MNGLSRREEIRKIHQKHRFFYEMFGGGVVLILCVLIGAGMFGGENIDYRMNLFTEGMGIVATVFMVNRWYAHRERERLTNDLKMRLQREAGSQVNQTALSAIEHLREKNWIFGEDSLLAGVNLQGAHLENANLWDANLKRTFLDGAILQGARLVEADLHQASLERAFLHKTWAQDSDFSKAKMDSAKAILCMFDRANLQHVSAIFCDMQKSSFVDTDLRFAVLMAADFRGANLHSARLQNTNLNSSVLSGISWLFTEVQNASLRMANLQGATIISSNLEGADMTESDLRKAKVWGSWLASVNLSGANLEEADLRASYFEKAVLTGANLDGAILPDGTRFKETTDMNRFTDRNHPDFGLTIEATNEQRERLQLDD